MGDSLDVSDITSQNDNEISLEKLLSFPLPIIGKIVLVGYVNTSYV